MKVRVFDSPHRVFVQSESDPNLEHLVDLDEMECSCQQSQVHSRVCKHLKELLKSNEK
jgi:hypothetical protein